MSLTDSDLTDARNLLRQRDPVTLLALADNAMSLARSVLREMKLSPGGDAYTYEGSTSEIDAANEAMEEFEYYVGMGKRL
jgi:hypothetical protein